MNEVSHNSEFLLSKVLFDINTIFFKQATTYYTFEVYAWTGVGPGIARVATIQSGVEPVLPEPPTRLAVSNIQGFSVLLQFTPGFDGNASITKWTVQVNNILVRLVTSD